MVKYKRIIAAVLLLNILLVATHEGEFWPFSIYPMFSQAGQPWSRGVVENVQDTSRADLWETKPIEKISNRILPLEDYAIHEIDYANYISKTKNWDEEKVNGLRSSFQIDHHPGQMWMATRVTGHIDDQNNVTIMAIPMFLFTADTTYRNPNIFSTK